MKKIVCLMLSLVFLCFSLCACTVKPKDFSWQGLRITLTEAFEEKEITEKSATYTSYRDLYAVEITYESLEDLILMEYDPLMTPEDYAEMSITDNELEAEVQVKDGVVYYNYTDMADRREFTNMVTVHRCGDGFWLVRFAALTEDYEKAEGDFISFAKTVTDDKSSKNPVAAT